MTLEQLHEAGFSSDAITRACRRGSLHREFPGVYLLGPPPSSPFERAMAAVLVGRPGGLLSYEWCRWLFGVGPLPAHDPDVTARGRRDLEGVTWHRAKEPPEPDSNRGIPCTRPERMLIDLAPTLVPADLRRLTNDVQIHHLTTAERIRDALASHPGRATRALAELVADDRGATRSLLEDLVDDLAREHGFAPPLNNPTVHGHEVDFHFPDLHLVLEADGYEWHWTRQQFHADREKWLDLEAHGEKVIPIGYRQVTTGRRQTAARLLRIITA